MKKQKWVLWLGIFYLISCFNVAFVSAQDNEGDSFWEEEFFQEEPKSRLEVAQDLLNENQLEQAISDFQKIIESPLDKTEYEEALYGLAKAYEAEGKINLAVRYYRVLMHKSDDADFDKIAKERINYYENYIINQFHIGNWYPKLWFKEKTTELATKYPKQEWLLKHGSLPILLLFYKFILILLLLGLALIFQKNEEKIKNLFQVNWGLKSIFFIYTLFLFIQLYLVFLLKPTKETGETAMVSFDVVSILSYLILTAVVLLYLTFKHIPWRRLGIGVEQMGHHLMLSLKYFVILVILFGIYAFLSFNNIIEHDKIVHSYPLSSVGTALYIFQFFLVVVVAPVSEEIFYRGFLYPVIRNKAGILMGIILVSLFFSMVHVQSFFVLFFLSFFLCFTYEKNRSLIPAILVHAFYNFLVRFGGAFIPS